MNEETKPEIKYETKIAEKEPFGQKVKGFWLKHWKKFAVGAGILTAAAGGAVAHKKIDDFNHNTTSWTDDDGREHVAFNEGSGNVEIITTNGDEY